MYTAEGTNLFKPKTKICNLMFIDTHSHLFLPEFDSDRTETVQAAIDAGITKIVMPNVDNTTIDSLLALVKQFPDNCFPLMGLHPGSVQKNFKDELKIVNQWLERYKFYGIGEIGMDLYWDKTYKIQQIEAFGFQVNLANQYELPIVIHSRESSNEILTILENFGTIPKGIFHCFAGTIEEAEKATNLGFKLGIGGVVTFKNSNLKEIVKEIKPEHIVLETDSPYLSPVPKRGKRNESAYICYIAGKIAEIWETTLEEVARVTTKNALDVFQLP